MVMAFTIDVKAAMIFVVVIPILCVIVFGIMLARHSAVSGRCRSVWIAWTVEMTRENLQGVRVIRAFRAERKRRSRHLSREMKRSSGFRYYPDGFLH
ncbi:MAG: hypothetical protein ACLTSZ_10445 [Lachnospiraceae bacterium]